MTSKEHHTPPQPLEGQKRWEALLRGQIVGATTLKFSRGIQLADQKAQALIFLNTILIPLALNWIDEPQFHTSALICIVAASCSILAAIICIYPKRKAGRTDKGTLNYLHFNDIGHMSREEYLDAFLPIFNDPKLLAETAVKDLHDTARNSMLPKFFWLKVAYTIFFFGNLIAIISILAQFRTLIG